MLGHLLLQPGLQPQTGALVQLGHQLFSGEGLALLCGLLVQAGENGLAPPSPAKVHVVIEIVVVIVIVVIIVVVVIIVTVDVCDDVDDGVEGDEGETSKAGDGEAFLARHSSGKVQ